jgi:hypothetical protein
MYCVDALQPLQSLHDRSAQPGPTIIGPQHPVKEIAAKKNVVARPRQSLLILSPMTFVSGQSVKLKFTVTIQVSALKLTANH